MLHNRTTSTRIVKDEIGYLNFIYTICYKSHILTNLQAKIIVNALIGCQVGLSEVFQDSGHFFEEKIKNKDKNSTKNIEFLIDNFLLKLNIKASSKNPKQA